MCRSTATSALYYYYYYYYFYYQQRPTRHPPWVKVNTRT
jgi:hypothetical protein